MTRYRTRPVFVEAQQFRGFGDGPACVVAMAESPTGYGFRVGAGFNAVSLGDWVIYHLDHGYHSAVSPDIFRQRYEIDLDALREE